MTLQELLNTDMATLARWARQGFAWWSRELAELVPSALRDQGGRAARAVAELQADGGFCLRSEDGSPAPPSAGQGAAVDLVLPASAVLRREIDLPRLSLADLRRAAEMNLDRLTPFTPDRVHFDIEAVERERENGRVRVRLGLITHDRARDALERAAAAGLRVRRLRRAGPSGGEFDFMPQVRAQAGDPGDRRRSAL